MDKSKPDRSPQLADKYVLRMPDGMRDKITALAKANNRSMNAEMVLMLQQAIDARANAVPGVDVDALAEAVALRVAKGDSRSSAIVEALAEALAPKLAAKLKDQNG